MVVGAVVVVPSGIVAQVVEGALRGSRGVVRRGGGGSCRSVQEHWHGIPARLPP